MMKLINILLLYKPVSWYVACEAVRYSGVNKLIELAFCII